MAKKSREMAAHWKTQIEQCSQEYRRFHERCKRISQRFRDERMVIDDEKKSLNLFWSNVQTLKPAIYSKTPVPICERRFLDKDTTGRVAATILERALRYEVAMSGFDAAMRRSRNDYLLVGRGQIWVRYNPEFGEAISPPTSGNDDIIAEGSGEVLEEDRAEKEETIDREVLRESLAVDYVHWQDYIQFPALVRTEEEIQGKGRRLYMSREDLIERWGKKVGKKIPLDHVPKSVPDEGSKGLAQDEEDAQATIYEIWWKPTRRVYFIAQEYDEVLEEIDDPLELEGFFPCPPALMATTTNDTMIPVPDFVESQDQYVQIDNLTKRIDILTNACKVVGVYDSSAQGLKRVFEEAKEPDLIPVDSWAMFAEKGGLQGAISFVPLKDISDTLQTVIEVRSKIIEDLDRVTGIWDIMRGTSDARETLGGQRLKQNNGSGRLQERQDDVARFARDVISIMGEIVSEHFDPKTLIQVSGALYDEGLDPPDVAPQIQNQLPPQIGHNGGPPMQGMMGQSPMQPPVMNGQPAPPSIVQGPEPPEQKMQRKMQMLAEAIELLRSDKLRGFRIDIETDSTVQGDAQQEKAARVEFVEGVTKFIETAAQVTAQAPEFAPLAAKMLQFAVRGFRVGRDLESAIEDFCEKAELDAKQAAANPQQKTDPKVQAEQIKANTEQTKAKAEIQAQQIEAASEQRNLQMEEQIKRMDMQMRQMEMNIEAMRARAEERKVGLDMAATQHEHGVHMTELAMRQKNALSVPAKSPQG